MLPRPNRVRRGEDYRAVYERGRARRGESCVCLVLADTGGTTRAGVVASRRVGGAVERNRAKRRLREALRLIWPDLPERGFDIVLVATGATGKVDYARLVADLRNMLAELGVLDEPPSAGTEPLSPSSSGSEA